MPQQYRQMEDDMQIDDTRQCNARDPLLIPAQPSGMPIPFGS